MIPPRKQGARTPSASSYIGFVVSRADHMRLGFQYGTRMQNKHGLLA